MSKEFIVVFDKNKKDIAQIFEAIVSEQEDYKVILLDESKFKDMPQVDKQPCLFIGDCSKHLAFESQYGSSDFGIEIGWKGKKAWIRGSDSFLWKNASDDFYNKFDFLSKKYGLSTSLALSSGNSLKKYYSDYEKKGWWVFAVPGVRFIVAGIKLKRESKMRHSICLYATLLFIDEYLKQFMKVEEV